MKKSLIRAYLIFAKFIVDPIRLLNVYKGLPLFFKNIYLYSQLEKNKTSFKIRFSALNYNTFDKFQPAGSINNHYFLQDLWAARNIYLTKPTKHVDVASRIDGFVAHVLPFCPVTYVDVRKIESNIENLTFIEGIIEKLPFADASVDSLSCLHVLEHIGLGRYGDPINPNGYLQGAKELARILKPGGMLYFSTPTGKEKLYFDAHRVFDPNTIIQAFSDLNLVQFDFINDRSEGIIQNCQYEYAANNNYGCGLYIFTKK